MAYQPIQLGQNPMFESMRGLGDTFVQLAQMQRQKQADLAAKLRGDEQDKRQAQQDFQATYMKAQQLAQAGDLEGAKALMAPYGAQMGQREVTPGKEWAPKLNQDELNFVDTMPQGPMGPPAAAQAQAQTRIPPSQQPPAGSVDAISSPLSGPPESMDALMQRAAPLAPQQQAPALAPAPHPLVAAAQADQAKKAQMAKLLMGNFGGQSWTLDPEAMRQAQQDRADQAFYQASGEGGDMADIVREQYPAQRAAAIAAGKPLNAQDTLKDFQAEAKGRASEAAAAQRDAMAQARLMQQAQLNQDRLDQSDLNNRRMTAAILGAAATHGGHLVGRTGEARKDVTETNKEITDAAKPLQAKGGVLDLAMHSQAALDKLKKNADNPTEWVNAVDSMIRTNTGRAAILSQYKLYTGKASGTDDELRQFWAQFTGQALSPQKKANLMAALESSNAELRDEAHRAWENFRATYDQDPRVQGNPKIAAHYKAIERTTFGRTPGYGGATEKPAAPAAPAAPAVNPLVRAAQMTDEDRQAIQWAQSHRNDPYAQQILKLHGM